MLAVGAADLRSLRLVAGAADQFLLEIEKKRQNDLLHGIAVAERGSRVQDVHRRRAQMHEGPHLLGYMFLEHVHERAHIVLRLLLFRVYLIRGD